MSNEHPIQDQVQRLKIILLDDDRLSSHNHSIQLKFVGESPLATTCENWQQVFSMLAERKELPRVLAIAIGTYKGDSLIDFLLQLHLHSPNLPILLLANTDSVQLSDLPETFKKCLLPLGERALNYQSLLAALGKARELMGFSSNDLPSRLLSPNGSPLFRSLSGESARIKEVRQLVMQAAQRAMSVVINGETGTGKEVVARNLHYHGGRAGQPFIVVNCAAVAAERFEQELFGVELGFGGSQQAMQGLLEKANGGTILFDEIGELPLPIQGKLLRFMEDRSFQRIGGHGLLSADVRILAGTRHNLLELIQSGAFRDDLYYRISVVSIDLPTLRERAEDIPDLLRELISSIENKGYESIRFNSSAIQSLQCHDWPGNVRELANLVERMALMRPDEVIGIHDLPPLYQYQQKQEKITKPLSPLADLEFGEASEAEFQAPAQASEPVFLQHGVFNLPPDTPEQRQESTFENIPEPPPITPRVMPFPVQPRNNSDTSGMNSLGAVTPPLNAEHLRQYLAKFEKQMLEVALDDCAGLLDFTADRLQTNKEALQERMQAQGVNTMQVQSRQSY